MRKLNLARTDGWADIVEPEGFDGIEGWGGCPREGDRDVAPEG